jgi:hypothetical protein
MRKFRILFVLILLALVPVSGVWPATARSSKAGGQKSIQTTALSLRLPILQRLWVGFWAKAGCGADPLGLCGPSSSASPTPSSDAGCGADPWGRCLPDH